ncbi:MAG: type VI secretion system baseplate subunit TssF [Desulforegulaceae bacterium]|nr:type VI secretion system baseplate subunit TssF [Desulforegulaceae bacterium]
MFRKYYAQELKNIRELASEFSNAHPSIAPMLEGRSQDPDVERLLEGMAFISGLLREKIDDEFPEITQGLLELTYPQYLRPIPSCTLFSFVPKVNLMEKIKIKKGSKIESVQINETPCIFSITSEIEVFPGYIESVKFEFIPGKTHNIKIKIKLNNINLSQLNFDKIRFFLNGSYDDASNLLYLILKNVQTFEIKSFSGEKQILGNENLVHSGFDENESLIPYPAHAFQGYRILQEYFILPEKFLFIDVTGLNQWTKRGNDDSFEIKFNFPVCQIPFPEITNNSFALFTAPGINIFDHDASPIILDHRQSEYKINPSGNKNKAYEIYSVEKVTGFIQGSVSRKKYVLAARYTDEKTGSYTIKKKISPVTDELEVFFSPGYFDQAKVPEKETLSIKLLCSNGQLPTMLQTGDISKETYTSPELCTFRNILPPTHPLRPPVKDNLWQYISHMSINLFSILNKKNLKELLKLYILPEGTSSKNVEKINKKIDGILSVKSEKIKILYRGTIVRGIRIFILMNSTSFASKGDLYIFGAVLNNFFATYCAINTFTELVVNDEITGEEFKWKPNTGKKHLI